MTRTADETLSLLERAATANRRHGDIFVSIHLNSLRPPERAGIETYYLGPSDGPEPDAIAAAENRHSGYSLSDMRSLLEKIYTDARRDESRRLAESVQHALVVNAAADRTGRHRPRREDGALRRSGRHRDARDPGRGLVPVERRRRQAA